MSGSMNYAILMNQGYSLVTDSGWNGDPKMGPAEREENYRASIIDAVIDERLKREKKRKEDDEMY